MAVSTTVSVALCTRNGAAFVRQQLDSVLSQSRLPEQIVISDDGSSDKTVAIVSSRIEDFDRRNPGRIEFIVIENDSPLGVAANFEQAIAVSSGELIALCDQDDAWKVDRLERAIALFDAQPGLLLTHADADLVGEDGVALGVTLFESLDIGPAQIQQIRAGNGFELLLKRNLVTGATAMIRRSLFDVARPVPSPWIHDEWLAIVGAAIGQMDVIPGQLIDYRQHSSNEIGARKLGLGGKFARMREPGLERTARLLSRAEVLVERFEQLGDLVSNEKRVAVAEKLLHEVARSALPSNRAIRWPRVLSELRTGRYGQFGRGILDAARDLIQPLNRSQ